MLMQRRGWSLLVIIQPSASHSILYVQCVCVTALPIIGAHLLNKDIFHLC